MFLLNKFNVLLTIFYWTGLAPFPTLDKQQQCYKYIVSFIVSILINVGLVVASFNFQLYTMYGSIEKIVNYAFVVSVCLSNLSANLQCYQYKSVYGKIIDQIIKLESIFNAKYSDESPFRTVARCYRHKVFAVTILLVISFALQLYEMWLQHDYEIFIIVSLSVLTQLISGVILFHVLLYICIVQMFIDELNRRIENAPESFLCKTKIEFLKTIKLMHMEVWKLMMLINQFFSWNLPFLVIHLAIQTTYYFYWIFLTLQVEWNLLFIAESLLMISYCLIKILLLVNCCQSVITETGHLTENIERSVFRTNDNIRLPLLKNEIHQQIQNFPIFVTADGYFIINRSFLAGVTSNCCTYIIIFIQFFLQSDTTNPKNKQIEPMRWPMSQLLIFCTKTFTGYEL